MRGPKGATGAAGGTVYPFSMSADVTQTAYYMQCFRASAAGLTSADITNQFIIVSAKTLQTLRIHCEANVTKSVTFTVYRDSGSGLASTGITCTLSSGQNKVSDLVNTQAFSQGDKVAIKITHTTGDPGAGVFYATLEAA